MQWRLVVCLALCAFTMAAQPKKSQGNGVAEKWLRSMTPRERAAQLLIVPFYGDSPNPRTKAYREFASLVRDLRVGGMIVLNRVQYGSVRRADPYQMASFLNRMQRLARFPLIVGGDFERGASMRMTSTTPFPHLMAYGAANDLEATRDLGAATARESRAMGVQWVFAPDSDVNNNPENPIINIRSFGEDPQRVAAQVKAFIEGAHSDPKNVVLTSAKHFPGHGDTATDSHIGLGVITASRERLDEVELIPFKAAIEAGVDSIMTAHLSVPALEPEEIPATVSRNIITGMLREQLGFEGLVTTDAMDMQGLSKMYSPGEAAVRALEAGVDVLLIPKDARETVRAIMAAVQSGRLTQKRIDASALKILKAKVRTGLNKTKLVDLEQLGDALDSPEDEEMAQRVADRAVTLVKNDDGMLPLKNPAAACAYVLGPGRFSTQGRDWVDSMRAHSPQTKATLLDPQLPPTEMETIAAEAGRCESIVLVAYVTASAYRGNVELAGGYPGFVQKVLAAGKPVALVAMGNPYLLRTYPGVAAYLATYSTVLPSEVASVKALLGEIEVDGHLPVTIPGLAPIGFGMKMEKLR